MDSTLPSSPTRLSDVLDFGDLGHWILGEENESLLNENVFDVCYHEHHHIDGCGGCDHSAASDSHEDHCDHKHLRITVPPGKKAQLEQAAAKIGASLIAPGSCAHQAGSHAPPRLMKKPFAHDHDHHDGRDHGHHHGHDHAVDHQHVDVHEIEHHNHHPHPHPHPHSHEEEAKPARGGRRNKSTAASPKKATTDGPSTATRRRGRPASALISTTTTKKTEPVPPPTASIPHAVTAPSLLASLSLPNSFNLATAPPPSGNGALTRPIPHSHLAGAPSLGAPPPPLPPPGTLPPFFLSLPNSITGALGQLHQIAISPNGAPPQGMLFPTLPGIMGGIGGGGGGGEEKGTDPNSSGGGEGGRKGKGGRKRTATQLAVEEEDGEELDQDEERKRNRVAVRRYREKKKKYVQELEDEVARLKQENNELRNRLAQVQDVNGGMRIFTMNGNGGVIAAPMPTQQ